MTFLAPLFFYLGIGLAVGAVALHFIVTRQPASSALPTVRFVPQSSVRVTTLAQPQHWWLMLLRVAVALLIGAAFARPVLLPDREPVARVIMADVSRSAGSMQMVRDSARALLGPQDALVVFDSGARVVPAASADSILQLEPSDQPGRLSPALVRAMRTASVIRDRADSIELVIVSSLLTEQVDAATAAIRALWPGRIRIVHVPPPVDSLTRASGIAVRAPAADDGVALSAQLAGLTGSDANVRVVRGVAAAADSTWAAEPGRRRTLVRWPAAGGPPGWLAQPSPDTAGAVIAGEQSVIYPFERRWQPGGAAAASGTVVSRWVDGLPAAVERTAGDGCIRDVAVPVPPEGDFVLRPSFARLVRELTSPCAAVAPAGSPIAPVGISELAGEGPLAAHHQVAAPESQRAPLVPWLIAAALLLLALEVWVRRGAAPMWTAVDEEPAPVSARRYAA